jgi:hypothetical protein
MHVPEVGVHGTRRGRQLVERPNIGGIPGFLSITLSTLDGRRQLGVMINVLAAPDPVDEAFTQVFRELGARLLSKRR